MNSIATENPIYQIEKRDSKPMVMISFTWSIPKQAAPYD